MFVLECSQVRKKKNKKKMLLQNGWEGRYAQRCIRGAEEKSSVKKNVGKNAKAYKSRRRTGKRKNVSFHFHVS